MAWQLLEYYSMTDFIDESHYKRFKKLIEEKFGLTLKTLDREVLSRRFHPRVLKHNMTGFDEYLDYLVTSPAAAAEWDAIPALIMNTESYFFREPGQFVVLADLLKKQLSAHMPSAIRIISAGCAAGQEPYSISLLIERDLALPSGVQIEIIGMDVNRAALEKAGFGLYNSYSFRSVPPESLNGHVKRASANLYKISKSVAARVTFSHGNILDAESFNGLRNAQIIFCRNVLIYMSKRAAAKIVKNLWSALDDHGYLFVSQTESILDHQDLFQPVRRGDVTVYRKKLP
ncbi:MAG: protein-glutamate O-methyltransferase CheR [Thermodesulfovibrionales bacterium]